MSRRYFLSIFLSATAAVMSAVASWAQNAPTQLQTHTFGGEVTVTATGIATEVDEAPAGVTVITRDEMDDAQTGSVVELLRRVPGLTIMASGDEGKQASVFSRGTSSNHTLVMLDGVRLNSPYFGGFDWSRLSTAGLEQVEAVRGPYSALWGADAVGGVVNLISARARSGLSGRFFGEGGSEGWQRLEASVGWGNDSFDLSASGFDRQCDGSLDNSDFTSRQLLVTAGWSFGRRGSRIGVLVQDLEAETGIPFAAPGSPTPNRRQDGEHTLLAIPVAMVLSDSWGLELTAASVDGAFEFTDPDDPYFPYSRQDTASAQVRMASNHRFTDHLVSWGGEWRRDEVTDESEFGTNLDQESVEITSLFIQDVWQMNPAVRLLLGVRWDDSDPWGSETSPRADLAWKLSDSLELSAGYGQAFRPPALGELYYPFSGNPELLPETSASTDLGLTWQTRKLKARWRLTAFSTDLDNLIQFDYATYSNANIGSAAIRGAEISWTVPFTRRGASFLQATYLNTEDDLGQPLLRRPEWSGSWTLHGAISERWTGELTVIAVGSREDVNPITYERESVEGYTTADISLAVSLWDGVEITARVLNAADANYEEVLGYAAPGRRYFVGMRLGVHNPSTR